jgi:cellulose synthase/poly-beta-1,6-N-acetylglucosamine synthase-like glycosyltransferase
VLPNLLFLAAGILRLASVIGRMEVKQSPPLPTAQLPTYAILVPLFREANIVANLVRAIEHIDYPRDRLSVNLVVEADDRDTLRAASRIVAGSRIRVIAVPPSRPRTKPKALDWALPFVDAELLTVYDAEDRPAPDQLRRAAAAFAAGPPDLVCIQAFLDIDHTAASSNWLSRQFALEYRVLFRSLLPWLARHGLFLPLGGTSNHFRRDALLRAGAWDPFNVTEDADIAVRIHRMGGRIGVFDSVTDEEAPLRWRAWHLQRTRWMKGWLQTWLVHMRHPLWLLRDIGIGSFVTFQAIILGQVLSALICPLGVVLIVLDLIGLIPLFADRDFGGDLLLAFQLLALCCGWLGAAAAVLGTIDKDGRMVRRSDLLTIPVYWLLLFGAAVNAIIELIIDPHRWNKTKHGLAERTEEPKPVRFPPRIPGSTPPPRSPSRRFLWNGSAPIAPLPPRSR